MILTEEQQCWCAERNLFGGFDDDDENKIQYTHVCEYVGGDGDPPRPVRLENMTRKKRVRIRRARNAWSRLRAHRSYPNAGARDETAHFHREQERLSESQEQRRPLRSPFCDGCRAWIGARRHRSFFGNYYRPLQYCRACSADGTSERDYERRVAAMAARKQPLAYPRQTSAAICRSPRLWCAGMSWPACDPDATPEEREAGSEKWANITCVDCLRILRERGCPNIEEGAT